MTSSLFSSRLFVVTRRRVFAASDVNQQPASLVIVVVVNDATVAGGGHPRHQDILGRGLLRGQGEDPQDPGEVDGEARCGGVREGLSIK